MRLKGGAKLVGLRYFKIKKYAFSNNCYVQLLNVATAYYFINFDIVHVSYTSILILISKRSSYENLFL